MKPHTTLYLKAYGYDVSDFIHCELCGSKAVDLHHIQARGKGGTKQPDRIENIMALCRECHVTFGDLKQHKSALYFRHLINMESHGVKFDRGWIEKQMAK